LRQQGSGNINMDSQRNYVRASFSERSGAPGCFPVLRAVLRGVLDLELNHRRLEPFNTLQLLLRKAHHNNARHRTDAHHPAAAPQDHPAQTITSAPATARGLNCHHSTSSRPPRRSIWTGRRQLRVVFCFHGPYQLSVRTKITQNRKIFSCETPADDILITGGHVISAEVRDRHVRSCPHFLDLTGFRGKARNRGTPTPRV
jgi:hypothetical protein